MGGSAFYTRDFPRRGEAAVLVVHVYDISSTVAWGFLIQSRNLTDVTYGDLGNVDASGTGTFTEDITGIKEVYRLEVTPAAGSSPNDQIHFDWQLIPRPYG